MDEISQQTTTEQAPEINLENLRTGKIAIQDIPRPEVARLWREEYATLEEGAKEVADAFGWKPKHFFLGKRKDGSEKEYKDWKEFDKEGKEKLPVLNERLKHTTKEKLEADEKIARLEAQIANMTKLQRMQAEREIKKDKNNIDAEIDEAFESGDKKRFAEAQERKAQIESEEKILKEFEPQQAKPAPILAPELILFKANNPWFEQDRVLTLYAKQLDSELSREYPNISLSQRFKMVEDDIRVNFADKFNKPNNPTPPAVESGKNGGRLTLDRDSEITFEQLPEDERNRAERMIRQKITTKADFMKGYNTEQKLRKQNRS